MICQFCRGALRAQRTAATSSLRSVSRIATSHRSAPPSSIAIIARSAAPRASWASSFTALRQFSSTSTRCSSREGAIADASAAAEPPSMTAAETAIADLLSSKLHPTELLVQDVSGGCGSMYAIDITSAAFRGQTILKQQRMVNAALGETMKGWHGVQIRTKVAPEAA